MDIGDIILLVLGGPIVLASLLAAFVGAVIFIGYILLAIGEGVGLLCEEIKWLLYTTAIDQLLKRRMNKTFLKMLISTLAKKLKTSKNVLQRRKCAGYLQTIYFKYPSSSLRNDIRNLNGKVVIYEGRDHTDRHNDYIGTTTDCYGECYVETHIDEHTSNIPAAPAEYFSVE
ncbi:MAG: hypothetical protein LBQ65_10550 [Tannerellaceae bacterium]|jgi:hypothetical protein|nr:hypothetical protein [Tannerellaceae bacterium]